MKKIAFLFFFISFSIFSQSSVNKLLSLVNQELKEVQKLYKFNKRDPEILLRLAELNFEKARLVRREENRRFREIPARKRSKVNRRKHFKNSKKLYFKVQKIGNYILKRFKKFRKKGKVYFILAYNAKEFNQPKTTKRYFKKALKYSSRGSDVRYDTALSLAEIYYNEKKYKRALSLYEQTVLKRKKSKWWTKDAFNLSWTYFKLRKNKKAIKLIEDVYRESSSGKFIDMRRLVERDLVFFYVNSNEIDKAVSFYKSNSKDIAKNLFAVAKRSKKEGRFSAADRVLKETLLHVKNKNQEIEVRISLFEVYKVLGKSKEDLANINKIFSYYKEEEINEELQKSFLYNLKNRASTIQRNLLNKKKRLKYGKKKLKNKLTLLKRYYEVISSIMPDEYKKNSLYYGEVLYSVRMYDDAAFYYNESLQNSIKTKNKKYLKRSLDSLSTTLSRSVTKKTRDKYLEVVYLAHLKFYPKSKRNFKIYQRLFSFYLINKRINDAEKVLVLFRKSYPKSLTRQEAMIGRIVNHFVTLRDKENLGIWVRKINNHEFLISKKFAKKISKLLFTIQFEVAEKEIDKGNIKGALKNYFKIYNKNNATKESKKNAAYNITSLLFDAGNPKLLYSWGVKTLELFNLRDMRKKSDLFKSIGISLLDAQMLDLSAEMFHKSFDKSCSLKIKNKINFFTNSIEAYLVSDQYEKSLEVIEKAKKCKISKRLLKGVNANLISYLVKKKKWDKLEEKLFQKSAFNQYGASLIIYLSDYYNQMSKNSNKKEKLEKEILKIYRKLKTRRKPVPYQGLDVVASLSLKKLNSLYIDFKKEKLSFPEDVFDKKFQLKIVKLGKIRLEVEKIKAIQSADGILKSYIILASVFDHFYNEVISFTPENKSKEYVESFKKSMKLQVAPLKGETLRLKNSGQRLILKNNVLSSSNAWFLNKKNKDIKYYSRKSAFIMDRGGGL